jgi:uncharacterized protein (DUF934 family)
MAAKAKPGDVTGRQREELIKEQAAEQVRKAEELTMATAKEAERLNNEILDLTQSTDNPTVIDEVEDLGVELANDAVIVRVADDIDMMTIGAGNYYSFKAGQKYKVAPNVAAHLKEKGFLYDRA